MRTETTIERVRKAVFDVGGFDEAIGKWPGPSDQDPLFYDPKRESETQARARGNAGLDSLDRVEVVMKLEDDFNICIPDSDTGTDGGEVADTWNTIAGIVAYIDGLSQA